MSFVQKSMAAVPPPPPPPHGGGGGWWLPGYEGHVNGMEASQHFWDVDWPNMQTYGDDRLATDLYTRRQKQTEDGPMLDLVERHITSRRTNMGGHRSLDGLVRNLRTTNHVRPELLYRIMGDGQGGETAEYYHPSGRRIPLAFPDAPLAQGGLAEAGPSHEPQQAAGDEKDDRTASPTDSDRTVDQDGFPLPHMDARRRRRAWLAEQGEPKEEQRRQTNSLLHARWLQKRMRRE